MEFQFSSHDYVTIQTTALDDPSKYVQCVFRLCVLGCVYSITCKSIVKVHAIVQNYLYCRISIPDFKQLKACDPTPQSHTTVCQCPHHSLQACQASGNGETYPAW